MALTNDYPQPIIVKIFKKGIEMPIKDLRGKTEVLDVIEIIEDDDIGTYTLEFTNTSSYKQDLTFIIKQIEVKSEAEKQAETEEEIRRNQLSPEEQRLYKILEAANQEVKHFEVEQQMQMNRISHFLTRKKSLALPPTSRTCSQANRVIHLFFCCAFTVGQRKAQN